MTALDLLLRQIDQAFDHRSWHGTNLRGSIRGLTAVQAAWRPAPKRHNIWELVLHAAYWKYAVRRRLLGEAKGSFPLKGSNFFPRPAGKTAHESDWKADVAILSDTHRSLRDAVAALAPADLLKMPGGGKVSNVDLIAGIVAHDIYHAGQIQILKRLQS
jgi:hypothetical protein